MKFATLALLFVSTSALTLKTADVSRETSSSAQSRLLVEVARINETPNRHDASGHKNV